MGERQLIMSKGEAGANESARSHKKERMGERQLIMSAGEAGANESARSPDKEKGSNQRQLITSTVIA